jgi:hypothetical protein
VAITPEQQQKHYKSVYQAYEEIPYLSHLKLSVDLAGLKDWLSDPELATTMFSVRPEVRLTCWIRARPGPATERRACLACSSRFLALNAHTFPSTPPDPPPPTHTHKKRPTGRSSAPSATPSATTPTRC